MSSSKRQKISHEGGVAILPDAAHASIGEYLTLPSRALFAAALTAPPRSWFRCHWEIEPSAASRAVVPPGSCSTLDFSEVEKDLAGRLSDTDLGAILACMDAANTLQTLKLTNCLNIDGRGLRPLRGSTALQFADLSLVGNFEGPEEEEDGGVLSEDIVIPILQSIIDAEGSLAYLSLPHKWYEEDRHALSQGLLEFHSNYAAHLYGREESCSGKHCNGSNPSGLSRSLLCTDCTQQPCHCVSAWFHHGGTQKFVCYQCGSAFCKSCKEGGQIYYCSRCLKEYCESCAPGGICDTRWCPNEEDMCCSGCLLTMTCSQCRYTGCSECARVSKCDECGESRCKSCNDVGGYRTFAQKCSHCERTLCGTCCEMQNCSSDECDAVICIECHPKGWECQWCKDWFCSEDDASSGQPECIECYQHAKTHCSRCGNKKLLDEDYSLQSVPASYWIQRGYDEASIDDMEKLLQELKTATLMLRSGEDLDGGVYLHVGSSEPKWDPVLLPHWKEFTNALLQNNYEFLAPFSLENAVLHSSVLDILTLALKEKSFTWLSVKNLGSSANAIKFVIDYAENHSKQEALFWEGTPVDTVESLCPLFAAIDIHPTLSTVNLKSICGANANGHDLVPLAFSLLRGTKAYSIDLDSNNIRTNGATDIPALIATNNPCLTSLRLASNHLDDSDALLIADALKVNTKLGLIDLGRNDITKVGSNALRSAIFDSASVMSVVNSNHTCLIVGFKFHPILSTSSRPAQFRIPSAYFIAVRAILRNACFV